jgi:galactose oxidase-like protein
MGRAFVKTDRSRPSVARVMAVLLAMLAILDACGSPQVTPAAVVSTPSPPLTPIATVMPQTPPTASPAPTAAPPTSTPSLAHWATTGSMREALAGIQAVKLGDGRILVVGQHRNKKDQVTATAAELWDPSTGSWREAGALDKIRTEFALVALHDGRALVVGGRNTTDESFSSAWAFDPDSEHWSKVGLMATARAASSVAVLPDGRVLVAGGYFAFKPNWGRRTEPVIHLAAFRSQTAAEPRLPAPLADVDVPPGGRALATAELFDPRTGTWSSTGSMRYARAGAPAVTLSDGRILIVGSTTETGSFPVELGAGARGSAEVYDPATGRFTRAGELPGSDLDPPAWARDGLGGEVGRVGDLAALDDGGAVLIGHTEWMKHFADLSTSYRFDAERRTWSEIGRPWAEVWDNGPRERRWSSRGRDLAGATVVTLEDGRVLVAGGGGMLMESRTPILATARGYEPSGNAWSKLPKLPSARSGAVGVRLDDGSVLIIGGRADGDVRWDVADRSTVRFVPGP